MSKTLLDRGYLNCGPRISHAFAQVHAVHLEQAKALEQAQETQSIQQMGELARRYAALEERIQLP